MILLNRKPITFTTFPNGETKVDESSITNALNRKNDNHISFKYETDADFMKLFFVKAYMDDTLRLPAASLLIYYMPYSRMDRSEMMSAFTLKYVAELINSMRFRQVTILEPHSDVTPALIKRVNVRYPTFSLLSSAKRDIGFDHEKDYLFFPDAGAQKRYSVAGTKHLVGYKHRDFQTGKIDSFQVVGEAPKEPFKAIIMDDLSSYGGTFMASATELKKLGATEIYLVIAHAENSILEGQIFKTDIIDKVFTTNSIIDMDKETDRLRIYEVEDIR